MGLSNLLRVCSALFLVAALNSAQANYIYDNATGSWKPTSRTVLAPLGSTSPFNYVPRDSPPTVTSTGAFQNKTGGTFGSPPINGTSKNVPVTLNGTTTKPNVNKALLSRLGKGGLAGLALGAGIDALLDGIGAIIDSAGNINYTVPVDELDPNAPFCTVGLSPNICGYSPDAVATARCNLTPSLLPCSLEQQSSTSWKIMSNSGSHIATVDKVGATCPDGSQMSDKGCVTIVPLPPDVLEDAINSGYNPHPSDYPFLAPDPAMAPTIVEVEPITGIAIPPITTTTIDLDTGITTTVETNVWQDYNVKDNNSEQPKIEAETTIKTDTYENGVKTGESTTTSSSGTASGTDPVAGAGSGQKLEIDIPTDCDFMPTVCAFLEWFKDDDLGEEPDLASIMKDDEEFAKTKVISFGAASCPQPYTIHISSLSMSVDLSFEFFCQFAEYARALVLAAAYIFAAYISLGVARG